MISWQNFQKNKYIILEAATVVNLGAEKIYALQTSTQALVYSVPLSIVLQGSALHVFEFR